MIQLKQASPTPSEGPSVQGILTWELDIPAGKTRTVSFVYEIKRPENWQLYSH